MKSFKTIFLFVFAGLFICAIIPSDNNYILSKGYTVSIHGTSNLHDWNETVGSVSGDAQINKNPDGNVDLNAVTVKMEVRSIKSDEGSIMNNNTYKALKADAHPEIIFTIQDAVKSIQLNSNGKTVSVKGNLMIAGVTRTVSMQVKIAMQDSKKLLFEGSQTIKMTDYGIDPPTALFGTLKTGNEITLSFKTSFTTN